MIVKELINIYSYCKNVIIDPCTKQPITLEKLSQTLPPSLSKLELLTEKDYQIPEPVLDVYARFRPTPLFRVERFEEIIGTDCEIYVKDEGATPTGNHKANSAYLIAYLCKKDGIKTLTTETTGNWGIALAIAGKEFGLETICFIDSESHKNRPDRKLLMEKAGAKVIVVELDNHHSDLLSLSADAAIEYTKRLKNAVYIFGSVYNYFITPQTIIGAEAKKQLAQKYPDIVVGSCGGGANLLGTAAAFIVDHLEQGKQVEIFSAESENCPILTRGKKGAYSVDSQNYYPLLETYGLDGLVNNEYIGGLGSTIVASPVAHFHTQGIIKAKTFNSQEAHDAAELFRKAEGRSVALETGYQLAGAIEKAKQNKGKVILMNVSTKGSGAQFA